jgi:alginate O-acetyltransferase complex protein AlgI
MPRFASGPARNPAHFFMVFSSELFLFYFLPCALAVYYLARGRGQNLVLTGVSYLFYGWANPLFMVLMLASTVVDYICGRVMTGGFSIPRGEGLPLLEQGAERSRKQRMAVFVSVLSNLSLLGFFKYFNFATDNYDALVNFIGLPGLSLDLAIRITLPLGISFYTFQSMSYTIDVYRGKARAIRNIIDFACYVSMFPQLVAGPIIRFSEVADQLLQRSHTIEKFSRGVAFLGLGLAKKILLANPCGKIADLAFDAGSLGVLDAWYGVIAYAFQIYFDFSGYSDMAIGLGLMLGFVFPKNFDSPYRSQSITEFWRRWHISLSSWLRDYLYVPLGGNRRGPTRTYINLSIVMLLGGLWHGAAWNFIIWGAMHGGMLAFERTTGKDALYRRLPKPARVAITFMIVLFSWVFFRAESLGAASQYFGHLFGVGGVQAGAALLGGVMYQPYYVLTFLVAALVVWGAPQTWDFSRQITPLKAVVTLALFWMSLAVLFTQSFNPFIYFIF